MKSFVTEVLVASLVLSMLIGAETAYAYSNIVAGSHPLPSPEMGFLGAWAFHSLSLQLVHVDHVRRLATNSI